MSQFLNQPDIRCTTGNTKASDDMVWFLIGANWIVQQQRTVCFLSQTEPGCFQRQVLLAIPQRYLNYGLSVTCDVSVYVLSRPFFPCSQNSGGRWESRLHCNDRRLSNRKTNIHNQRQFRVVNSLEPWKIVQLSCWRTALYFPFLLKVHFSSHRWRLLKYIWIFFTFLFGIKHGLLMWEHNSFFLRLDILAYCSRPHSKLCLDSDMLCATSKLHFWYSAACLNVLLSSLGPSPRTQAFSVNAQNFCFSLFA